MTTTPVALVTHNLAAGGGTGTMTGFLWSSLRSAGFNPHVFSLAASARDEQSVSCIDPRTLGAARVTTGTWRGIPFEHVGTIARELEPARYVKSRYLARRLAAFSAVIVIAGTGQWYCRVSGIRPTLLWVATTVANERTSRRVSGSIVRRASVSLFQPAVEWYERRGLTSVPVLFALSPYSARAIQRLTGRCDVTVAPCGVDTELFRPSSRPSEYLLSAARFSDPRKQFAILAEAYAQIVRQLPSAPRLVVAGEPPLAEHRELLARLGIDRMVDIVGLRSPAELRELHAGAKAFIVSSDEEGLCIAALEAMASGVPVVSTRCGGPEAFIDDGVNGRLVEIGKPDQMSEALLAIIGDETRRRDMGRNARTTVEAKYSSKVAAQPFITFLDRFQQ